MGDLLRIDLTTRTFREETVPPELIKELIGVKGIGTHYLCEEVGPQVDPLSPEAKLIFVVGPMAGTSMLGSNRYALYFASPLTNAYCECYSGGYLAPQFAKTGYKVVIVEGKAEGRVYLEISEQGVAFHSAEDLWGLDAFESEDKILERTAHKKAQACAIGQAGENLVRFACVNNNHWHQLGRGGPGAVFGSKNLKGIVWHGDKKVEVARPDDYKAVVRDLVGRTKDDPGVAAYARGGLCEILDFAEIMWLNDICDRLGVDTMSAGNLCALAIEASQRGLIDEKMDFGDPDCVAAFLRKMCLREGIGDIWAEGILRVEQEYGLEGVAVHVKGMEPAGYDPRAQKGMGLGFATATRGACHLRATMYKPELIGVIDPREIVGKAAIYCDWEDRLTIMDCLVYCRFYRDLVQWPYITAVVNAAIGTDYTEDDLHGIANRIVTMTHDFNAARGIGRESERLPEWVSDKPMEDETAWTFPQSEMEYMLGDYYAIRGWGDLPDLPA